MSNSNPLTTSPPLTRADINRSAISRGTGLELAHISRIFSGKSRPSWDAGKKIADYLDISMDELNNLITQD